MPWQTSMRCITAIARNSFESLRSPACNRKVTMLSITMHCKVSRAQHAKLYTMLLSHLKLCSKHSTHPMCTSLAHNFPELWACLGKPLL